MKKINIALGASQDWLRYSLVTVCSILLNASRSDKYCFYILSDGFSDEIKKQFQSLNKIIISEQ